MEAAKVNGGTAGGAAVVDYITAGGAVEVNYGATGRQQGVGLFTAGRAVGCRYSYRRSSDGQNGGQLQAEQPKVNVVL